ncbi:hypothetical protein [Saccharibacillus brassicae]|uniref:SMI1/KNR4 family protein n=1 Tax=Saccharibacillus brassicae TaxID=2583377 RepID=A0A4Y6V4L1_SACBS|nr:hypothetical protein [Saccharibacillus brassicae]QDH23571.1 hypothetical protein FFV09_23510 [Saccharibacillus brassicae]
MDKQVQLERIIWKLKMAARKDSGFKEFGANRHGYRMNEPITAEEIAGFEASIKAALPAEFAQFLQTVGNGGAGPYYGISPLHLSGSFGDPGGECVLEPGMAPERWQEITAFLDDPSLDEAGKKSRESELYGGLLAIGEMGWTFEMMLVLQGPCRGRVVYVDRNHQIPFFTYEVNFLEWYERWLDEIIGGYDTDWFALERAGDEVVLVDLYLSSLEERVKVSAIQGMHKLKKLKPDAVSFLLEQGLDESAAVRLAALEILAQKNYAEAMPLLIRAIGSPLAEERLNAARQIDAYGEAGGGELAIVLASRLPEEDDARVLCQVVRILEQGPVNPLNLLIPFFGFADRDMRREAVFHAARLPGREAYASDFGRALDDADALVRKAALGALEGLLLGELLPKYEALLHDTHADSEFRRAVLSRLGEYGPRARDVLARLGQGGDPDVRADAKHLLGRIEMEVNKS